MYLSLTLYLYYTFNLIYISFAAMAVYINIIIYIVGISSEYVGIDFDPNSNMYLICI